MKHSDVEKHLLPSAPHRVSKGEAGDQLERSRIAGEDAGEIVERVGAGDQKGPRAGERGEVDIV